MKFVFVSYINTPSFNHPEDWIKRIKGYLGIQQALSRLGHTVIRIEQINYEGACEVNGVQHYFMNFGKEKLYFPWRLHRFVGKLNPDVVIVNGLHFPLQVIQLRLQLGNKVKIIGQNHAEKPFNGVKKYLQGLADRCIDAYFFSSKAMGEQWVNKGNLTSLQKIHEIMEVSSGFYPIEKAIAKSKVTVAGSPVYLWVGRMNQNKDPITVVKAFLHFAAIQASARLYMIFQTTELLADARKQIAAASIGHDAIVLVGKVSHDEMINWYNNADFIISSSHYEGSGTAVCEGMSCGCIPVLTDIHSFRMMTDNGNFGFLYPPGNEDELLSALIKTITINMSANRHKILEQFNKRLSFDAIAREMQDVANSL